MAHSQDPQSAITQTYFEHGSTRQELSDWEVFNGLQSPGSGSYFMESPLSTGRPFYTPLDHGHLKPFESAFRSVQSHVPFNDYSKSNHPDSAVGYQSDCGIESTGSLMVTPPCVNLSSITIDDSLIDDKAERNIGGKSQPQAPTPSPSTGQPTWASARRVCTLPSSRPHEHRKRTKSETHAKRLRSNSISSPIASFNPSGPRTSHNLVEKQYRNRLNGQFDILLNSLPNEGGEKRVSKAEVLILAKERIKELEGDRKTLEAERAELQLSFKGLKERWVDLGGICMP